MMFLMKGSSMLSLAATVLTLTKMSRQGRSMDGCYKNVVSDAVLAIVVGLLADK